MSLPGISSDSKPSPYTTGNLQRSATPCHLTQSGGETRAPWNFCRLHPEQKSHTFHREAPVWKQRTSRYQSWNWYCKGQLFLGVHSAGVLSQVRISSVSFCVTVQHILQSALHILPLYQSLFSWRQWVLLQPFSVAPDITSPRSPSAAVGRSQEPAEVC